MLNDIKGLSDVTHPTLVQFFGAYRSPDGGQISLVLELLDRGSLADLTKQVDRNNGLHYQSRHMKKADSCISQETENCVIYR